MQRQSHVVDSNFSSSSVMLALRAGLCNSRIYLDAILAFSMPARSHFEADTDCVNPRGFQVGRK
jgi:hypothetical protein